MTVPAKMAVPPEMPVPAEGPRFVPRMKPYHVVVFDRADSGDIPFCPIPLYLGFLPSVAFRRRLFAFRGRLFAFPFALMLAFLCCRGRLGMILG
jgi:hypothetical protein